MGPTPICATNGLVAPRFNDHPYNQMRKKQWLAVSRLASYAANPNRYKKTNGRTDNIMRAKLGIFKHNAVGVSGRMIVWVVVVWLIVMGLMVSR